ncbi:hypothetical protein C8F04DRAFT_1117058 [Mycena alexandri]|uniref:Uncharacterized protein n=1 Tax=Mycena alexandri TaxID=1745969 RepID=A0AAD6WVT2_9AGAR|nr:hypothetical protein C8F04DRAFT_1117058 [Mycena alexandri]
MADPRHTSLDPHYSSLAQDYGARPNLSPVRNNLSETTVHDHQTGPAPKRGVGIWTPLCIVGGTVLTAILAILHHIFDSHLNGRPVTGYWTQTKSSQVEIFLATAVKILFCFSAGISLCQVSWYSMRRQPLGLADINAVLSEPSIMTLPRRNLIFQAPGILAITAAILVSPLITIFAPSLTVRQAPSVTRILTVPTLNLTTDAQLNDFSVGDNRIGLPSSTWDKAALLGLLSSGPVGWPIPNGCSPECRYNISYTAPALFCTDLAPDQIADGMVDIANRYANRTFQDPPSAYLTAYDGYQTDGGAALNCTVQDQYAGDSSPVVGVTSDTYGLTLAYVPYAASNADDGAVINAAGATCIFYNATHQLTTHFFNSTQESTVSVVEFLAPLNTTYKAGQTLLGGILSDGAGDGQSDGVNDGQSFRPGFGAQLHLLAMADAFTAHLTGNIWRDGHTGVIETTNTLLPETGLFGPIVSPDLTNQFRGLNVSSSVTNTTQALAQLIANATLSYMQLNTGFTTVTATVPSTENVYSYTRTALATTYLVSFVILVLISGFGMFCLISIGEPGSNEFSYLLVATRNPNLDPVAAAVEEDPGLSTHSVARTRLVFGDVHVPGRGVTTAFGLASEQDSEMVQRQGFKA